MGDLTDDLHGVYKALHTAGNEAVEDYENFKKTNFSDFEHNIFLMNERRGKKSGFGKSKKLKIKERSMI